MNDPDPATATLNGVVLTARVDGEWACSAEATGDGAAFTFDDGVLMIDVEPGGTAAWWKATGREPGDGGLVPLERYLLEGGVSSYIAHRDAPVDGAELYDVDRAEVP